MTRKQQKMFLTKFGKNDIDQLAQLKRYKEIQKVQKTWEEV